MWTYKNIYYKSLEGKTGDFLKKILSCILAVILCINASVTTAATQVMFGANDYVYEYKYGFEPIIFGGEICIPYTYFLQSLDVMSVYNETQKVVLLYNFDHIITFDLAADTIHDEHLNVYRGEAFYRGSNIYVPAETVCEIFEFDIDVIYGEYEIVRITNGNQSLSNDIFEVLVSAKNKVNISTLPSINNSNNNTSTSTSGSVSKPTDEPDELQTTQITPVILGDISQYTKEYIDEIDDNKFTFFVDDTITDNDEMLRYLYINDHEIGIYVPKEEQTDIESVISYINKVNNLIFENLSYKTRLIIMENNNQYDNELLSFGYETFDVYIDGFNKNSLLDMKNTTQTIVNVTEVEDIDTFIDYCEDNKFIIQKINAFK